MELIKPLCSQFVEVMERQKYTRLFAYYTDGTEMANVDVSSVIVLDDNFTIEAEDYFRCTINFSDVKNAYCEAEPDGVVELSLYLVDGTEFAIDTYA